jgi:hydroxymethylbilane synthase
VDGDSLSMRAMLFTPDGKRHWQTQRGGAVKDAVAIGDEAGRIVRADAGETYQVHLR